MLRSGRTLLPSKQADEQDSRSVDSKESSNGIELRGKDLEYDEGERELSYRCPNVRALKRSLRSTYLHKFIASKYNRTSPMLAEPVIV
jgi:hypothetical protein